MAHGARGLVVSWADESQLDNRTVLWDKVKEGRGEVSEVVLGEIL